MDKIDHLSNQPSLIIISGLAASGKTFIAQQLATKLQLRLISKDSIKELLYDVIELKDLYDATWSRKLTTASMLLMYQAAEVELKLNRSCIIESTFHPKYSIPDILKIGQRCPFNPIQVLCYAEGALIIERFKRRATSGKRHSAHLDLQALSDPVYMAKLASGRDEIMEIGGQVIEVDTGNFEKVDLNGLATKLSSLI